MISFLVILSISIAKQSQTSFFLIWKRFTLLHMFKVTVNKNLGSTKERKCHNRKGLLKSVDIFRRLSFGISICIFLFILRPPLHNKREFLAHLSKRFVI